jgi:hypothetical protein
VKYIRITLVAFVLFLVLAQTTAPSRAWWLWVDELGDCAASAIAIGNSLNQELEDQEITQQEWESFQDQNLQQMQNCITQINVATQDPDYCAAARAARDQCVMQFYGLGIEFSEERMECMMASGINQCE